MRTRTRSALAAILIAVVASVWPRQPEVAAQSASAANGTRVSIAAATAGELGQWSALLDSRLADGSMRRRVTYGDPALTDRVVDAFVQYHDGIEVYGGDVSRVRDDGRTVAVTGTVYTDLRVDTRPGMDAAAAAQAIERLAGSALVGEPRLAIVPAIDGRFVLTYRGTTASAVTYFVDATTGDSVMQMDEWQSQAEVGSGRGALGDTKKVSASRRGGMFAAWDLLRPAPILTLDTRNNPADFMRLQNGGAPLERDLAVDADNTWTDAPVVDLHANLGLVYDYFFKRQNYLGIDGNNGTIAGVVNTSALLPNNAFFTPPPFGPGGIGGVFFGATTQGTPFTVLDIVGHEVMHGIVNATVTRRTGTGLGNTLYLEIGPSGCAAPFYCDAGRFVLVSNDPGALNEGLADVFGAAIEFFSQPAGTGPLRADYVSGEDLGGGGGRSIANPSAFNSLPQVPYPDHFANRILFPLILTPTGPFLCGTARCDPHPTAFVGGRVVNQRTYVPGAGFPLTDNGAVHLNLTIIGHAFYLAIEGGTNRTSGRTVVGVGAANREQVERVFFIAVRDLLPRGSSFQQAATAVREAARITYGPAANVTRAVNDALLAVGL